MAEFSSRSQRVRELCRRLAPFIGKKAEEIHFAYLAEDKTGKEQIEIYLEALVSQYLVSVAEGGVPIVGEKEKAYPMGR